MERRKARCGNHKSSVTLLISIGTLLGNHPGYMRNRRLPGATTHILRHSLRTGSSSRPETVSAKSTRGSGSLLVYSPFSDPRRLGRGLFLGNQCTVFRLKAAQPHMRGYGLQVVPNLHLVCVTTAAFICRATHPPAKCMIFLSFFVPLHVAAAVQSHWRTYPP